jgi:pilus assembly protein CpaB
MGRRTVLMLVAILVAALGSTLVFLYVQGINDRAIADQEPVKVLTATDTITPGESIDDAMSSGKLALTEIPKANVLPEAMTSTEALQGQLALTTIYEGEQILPAKFGANENIDTLTYPKGTIATSVQLTDFDRVAGFVQPGSKVAIFVCVTGPTPAQTDDGASKGRGELPNDTCPGVRLLLSDVEVIGVGSTSLITKTTKADDGSQTTEELPKAILTVALSQADTEKLLLARKNQDITFALMNDDSNVAPSQGTYNDNLFK